MYTQILNICCYAVCLCQNYIYNGSALGLRQLVCRAFDVDLLHIAEHFSIPVSEIAVNWHEIPGMYYRC